MKASRNIDKTSVYKEKLESIFSVESFVIYVVKKISMPYVTADLQMIKIIQQTSCKTTYVGTLYE